MCRLKAREGEGGEKAQRGVGEGSIRRGQRQMLFRKCSLNFGNLSVRCEAEEGRKETERETESESERACMTSLKLASDAAAFSDFHIKA